jgi:hypothetical protein
MIEWFATHWGWLLASLVFGGYFAFYILAMREQRSAASDGKSRLPCDRC